MSVAPRPPEGSFLLTGAGGFIGAHLTRRLLEAGREVILADLTPPATLPAGAQYVRIDLRDKGSVRQGLQGLRPTWAVHLAAKVGDWGPRADFESVNVTGARALLEGVCERGVTRAVHISSIAAMGLDAGPRADASAPPVGAGDAYLSVAAPCARLGYPPELTGFLGNAVGALAVRIVGNAQPVTPENLVRFIRAVMK
jgi:nucleoside-diphosphate-sugar epimerase